MPWLFTLRYNGMVGNERRFMTNKWIEYFFMYKISKFYEFLKMKLTQTVESIIIRLFNVFPLWFELPRKQFSAYYSKNDAAICIFSWCNFRKFLSSDIVQLQENDYTNVDDDQKAAIMRNFQVRNH